MKVSINHVFEMLGIEKFKPEGWESTKPEKKGIFRDYFTHKMNDGRSFLLMSNEYTLDKKQMRVGAPDPALPIWCVLMPDTEGKHTWVIQYSNKEGATSKVKGEVEYSRQ